MKSFLFTLKVWLTVIFFTCIAFVVDLTMSTDLFAADDPGTYLLAFMLTLAFTFPFALVVWLTATLLYKKDRQPKKKTRWLALWGALALIAAANFIPDPSLYTLLTLACMLGGFLIALLVFRLPSRQTVTVTDGLKGRHILLRVQENNLMLRGVVLSELNIWPIKIKLHDHSPNSLLELHSMKEDEVFTSLSYQTSVKVKAFTADRREFLFAATLEMDHTLN